MASPTTTWQPALQGLQEIVGVLLLSHAQPQNKEMFDTLSGFSRLTDYNKYLCYILIHMREHVEENIRAIAADEHIYLKQEVIKAVADPSGMVQKTGASLITTLVRIGGLKGWPSLLPFLLECLGNSNPTIVLGSFFALKFVCEDHPGQIDNDEAQPLNFLLPKFLHFFQHPDVRVRKYALECLNPFLALLPPTLVAAFDNFMTGFFFLATNDPDPEVQTKIVAAYVTLVETEDGIMVLDKFLPSIFQYILIQMNSKESDLALAATEFWTVISRHDQVCCDSITPFLPQILPCVLERMIYSEEDLLTIGPTEEDSHLPDKAGANTPRGWGQGNDDDGDEASEWTVRKCAAEALDYLCVPFVEGFLPVLLPLIEKGLQDPDWKIRERSILALGCISKGQGEQMIDHLPGLVPFLFTLTRDEKPLIRSISCWVLAQYSEWILAQSNLEIFPHRLFGELLTRLHDKNKEVQKGACGALAHVAETAEQGIAPYVQVILSEFSEAFNRYQASSLIALYDALGAVVSVMGRSINEERYLSVLLPPLLTKWDLIQDDDTPNSVIPLFDCFHQVAIAIGPNFLQYTRPIFLRCVKIMETFLLELSLHDVDPIKYKDVPSLPLMAPAFDLLSGLFDAVGGLLGPLVDESGKFLSLLYEICKTPSQEFSQSAFAVVGDLARYYPSSLAQTYPAFLNLLFVGTSFVGWTGMCNNAFWAAGEIFIGITPQKPLLEIQPPLKQLVERFFLRSIDVLKDRELIDVRETVAVLIGRLCWISPTNALHVVRACDKTYLFHALRNAKDEKEKAQALRGICEVIRMDPEIAMGDFQSFCEMLGLWGGTLHPENVDVVQSIGVLLHSFRNSLGDRWTVFYNQFPDRIKQNFQQWYRL